MKRARSESPSHGDEGEETAEVKQLPPVLDTQNDLNKGSVRYAFKPDFNDHFETSITAFMDLVPVMAEVRQSHMSMRRVPFQVKTEAQDEEKQDDAVNTPTLPIKQGFVAYDPYYCNGLVKQVLARLGLKDDTDAEHSGPKSWYPTVSKTYNENRDFYGDIAAPAGFPFYSWQPSNPVGFDSSSTPLGETLCAGGYSMCVTNPPYSEDHIIRFLKEFALPSHRPWAMLVPDYIPNKKWYKDLIAEAYRQAPEVVASKDAPAPAAAPVKAAFVAPPRRTTPGKSSLPAMFLNGGAAAPVAADEPLTYQYEAAEPFYLFPKGGQQSRYEFHHPKRVGREQSHFGSLWIVWCGFRRDVTEKAIPATVAASSAAPVGVATPEVAVAVASTPEVAVETTTDEVAEVSEDATSAAEDTDVIAEAAEECEEAENADEEGETADVVPEVPVKVVEPPVVVTPLPISSLPTNEERVRHNAILKALKQGGYEEARKRVVLKDVGGDGDALVRDLQDKEEIMLLKRRGIHGNTDRSITIVSNLAELYPAPTPMRRDFNNNTFNSRGGSGGRGGGRGGSAGRGGGGGRGMQFGRGGGGGGLSRGGSGGFSRGGSRGGSGGFSRGGGSSRGGSGRGGGRGGGGGRGASRPPFRA